MVSLCRHPHLSTYSGGGGGGGMGMMGMMDGYDVHARMQELGSEAQSGQGKNACTSLYTHARAGAAQRDRQALF